MDVLWPYTLEDHECCGRGIDSVRMEREVFVSEGA